MMQGIQYGHGAIERGGGPIGGIFMFMVGLALIAGIVLLVVWVVRSLSHPHQPVTAVAGQQAGAMPQQAVMPAAGHEEAIAIAKRRFAGGEITKEQYEEIIATLGS